ncbi:MAG: M20/M25/M40 family metallo-hydrolase [Elusimicrobiaceae bacterium]|nr:M20/M25/M40 family metallo-hydrolase [Elusimicrobiaceae bacterium]
MKKFFLFIFFTLICVFPLQGQDLDIEHLYQEAKNHLIHLLEIDTSKPEPNETAAVRYLYKELNKHGIDWDFLSPRKGAANLLARIKGSDPKAKPLLLISHLDTAPAGDSWSFSPFKATLKDGNIYGLGATDAKNYTAMHLALLTQIKDSGLTPKRDIIFLATSGEESGSDTGIKWIAETQWNKIKAGFALNEGGGIIKDSPEGSPIIFAEAGTKMYMDIKITAFGEAAHSSVPVQENAVYRLSEALAKLPQFTPPAKLIPTTQEFFTRIATLQNEDGKTTIQLLLSGTDEQKQMAADIMAQDSFFQTQLRDTITPVNISSGTDTGASSAEASAIVNVRLLPATDPDEFVNNLRAFLASDDFLTVEILERPQLPFPEPMDGNDELFASISATAQRLWTKAVPVPGMSPASGDGEFLRRLGVITYGIGPSMYEQAEGGAHTADEYISEQDFKEQVHFFAGIVYDFALGKNIFPSQEENTPDLQTIPENTEENKL